jgi:uncharacterized protein YcfJ
MKRILVLATAAALAAPVFATPQFATAQSARSYGGGDICRAEQRRQANRGTLAGGLTGAVVGGVVAGHGNTAEGALLGGAVGAVAGHEIAKHRVDCSDYPRRISRTSYSRSHCRWVQEYYNGREHGFEVCRGRDGVWRPSGRS